MTHPDVIRVDHQELVSLLIAHALSKGWLASSTWSVNRKGHRRRLPRRNEMLVMSDMDCDRFGHVH